ncbi:hypothetical protein COX05_04615 [candidate division WWE3 bacterium CG22_combo_CG10-13_8_21_14_all_39_12]|uniref:Antitoxin n=1 Tax=candidate division WWE3 bacterium CG22_combo_CG10-13_8_21_14_all_39_12 TaxID=1975094 RepID=A0A2H0BGM0_UNCKA|nr:MAG: hypothetical protein COX05_04615 [candidate division WWE3 bacterium CG22_combo_CG10-13_8_21_14_all_39_12]
METISTSQLRTKSSDLIKTLANGSQVTLIHRSTKVGVISPTTNDITPQTKTASTEGLKDLVRSMPKSRNLSDEKRKTAYLKHLSQKYG